MTMMSRINDKFNELYLEVTATRYVPGARPTPSDVWKMATLLVIEDIRSEKETSTENP